MREKKRLGVGSHRTKSQTSVCAYFETRLDDGDRQHEHPRHSPGPGPQQHSLKRPRVSFPEKVLL